MNKFDLVLLIIKFMKDNHHLKIVDLGFKNPLELLVDNDYKLKSYNSADKILSKIPNSLHHYFFRGLIDGDGCFYLNK